MKTQVEIKLSSNWTLLGLYGGIALALPLPVILITIAQEQEFHGGMAVAEIIYLVLVGFLAYLFLYISDDRMVGDQPILKKQFRPSKIYMCDKIGHPTSFRIKRTKYITGPHDEQRRHGREILDHELQLAVCL